LKENLRLKNNLLQYNQKLRYVITTKRYDNQVTFKIWLWKSIYYINFLFMLIKK